MKRIILLLIILFIVMPSVLIASPPPEYLEADLKVGFGLDDANDISIGFSSEPVSTLDQEVDDISGRSFSLKPDLSTLTASLSESIYVYAQILYAGDCSVSISASPMTGSNERLGWNIGTGSSNWISINEDDSLRERVIWTHAGSAENIDSVYSAPLSVVTHSFDEKQSSGFSGSITLIISEGIERGGV